MEPGFHPLKVISRCPNTHTQTRSREPGLLSHPCMLLVNPYPNPCSVSEDHLGSQNTQPAVTRNPTSKCQQIPSRTPGLLLPPGYNKAAPQLAFLKWYQRSSAKTKGLSKTHNMIQKCPGFSQKALIIPRPMKSSN